MFRYKDKTALVTGASTGIGAVFARQLAAKGANVVLVARNKELLNQLAAEIQEKTGVKAIPYACDLTEKQGVDSLIDFVSSQRLDIDILVNNAGFGSYGVFEDLKMDQLENMIELNIVALTRLTHEYLPQMKKKGEGAIVNVASTAAHQPVPFMATYGATKAFVLSFSEALWYENKNTGVRVLSLDPGNTDTPFHDRAKTPMFSSQQTAEQVVATGMKALEEGRCSVISGFSNWLLSGLAPRVFPRQVVVDMAGSVMKRKGE